MLQLCHLHLQLDWARVREREKSIPRVLENVRLCRECICVLWCLVLVSLLLCGGGLFITKGVWQGHMPRLATEGQSLAFLSWLDGVGGRGRVYCVPVSFLSLPTWLINRAASPTFPAIHRPLLTTSALLSKWSGLIWDKQTAVKFYPFGLCTCFISQTCLRSVKVRGCNEWFLEAIFHSFSTKFQQHHVPFK